MGNNCNKIEDRNAFEIHLKQLAPDHTFKGKFLNLLS